MNQREIDVLNILFSTEEEMTVSEIVDRKRELTQSTVTVVLRKLLSMDYVDVTGTTHSGKVLSRTYRPTEAARKALIENFLKQYEMIREVIPPKELCKLITQRYCQKK